MDMQGDRSATLLRIPEILLRIGIIAPAMGMCRGNQQHSGLARSIAKRISHKHLRRHQTLSWTTQASGKKLWPPLVYRIQMQCIRRRYTLPVLEPGIDVQWGGYFGGGVTPRLRISA